MSVSDSGVGPQTLRQRLRSSSAILAIAATATGGVALLAVAWLATLSLSGGELGFFFSFLSLGAVVQIADFGLSYAALQTGGRLAGTNRLHELPAIARYVTRWIAFSAGLATVVAGAIGFVIFSSENASAAQVAWTAPWIGYLISVLCLQVVTPGVFLREGSGKVLQMWRLRFIQELIGATACLTALYCGAGLWSLSAYAGTRAVVGALWLLIGDPLRSDNPAITYSLRQWMTDIWPFQWKIGVSGLAGYLIFRSFAPIVLLEQGPIAAGSFGLAISFMNLLIAISTAWPMSQAARYSKLAASQRHEQLHREFPRMLLASTIASVAETAIVVLVLAEARRRGISFALRLPEPWTTTCIFSTAVVHHVVVSMAVALRSEGREPLLIPSVVGGIVNIAAIWLTAHYGTLNDIALVNFALALIGIPIAGLLLRARKRHLLPASVRR